MPLPAPNFGSETSMIFAEPPLAPKFASVMKAFWEALSLIVSQFPGGCICTARSSLSMVSGLASFRTAGVGRGLSARGGSCWTRGAVQYRAAGAALELADCSSWACARAVVKMTTAITHRERVNIMCRGYVNQSPGMDEQAWLR